MDKAITTNQKPFTIIASFLHQHRRLQTVCGLDNQRSQGAKKRTKLVSLWSNHYLIQSRETLSGYSCVFIVHWMCTGTVDGTRLGAMAVIGVANAYAVLCR